MSSSTPNLRFLLDENVHHALYRYLVANKYDVKLSSKSASDLRLAGFALQQKRIFVTNDIDFSEYPASKIFGLIWLRIPQGKPDLLIHSFKNLLVQNTTYQGRFIILTTFSWRSLPLTRKGNNEGGNLKSKKEPGQF